MTSWNRYYCVYIATNKFNTVLYTGVTNNLLRRMYEHKKKLVSGFTEKYNINKLVWFEVYEDIKEAINREKQIKGGSRNKKICTRKIWKYFTWKDLDILNEYDNIFEKKEDSEVFKVD